MDKWDVRDEEIKSLLENNSPIVADVCFNLPHEQMMKIFDSEGILNYNQLQTLSTDFSQEKARNIIIQHCKNNEPGSFVISQILVRHLNNKSRHF